MKLPFTNEGIFEPHKSPVEKGESSYLLSLLYVMRIQKFSYDFKKCQKYS